MTFMSSNVDALAAAVGRVPSGCGILTAAHADRSTGMLASWFQQVSFEPLAISICVRPDRPIVSLMTQSRRFVLNVLGQDPKAMFRHFGRGFTLEEDAFTGLACEESDFGPVLSDSVAAVMACSIVADHLCGDHRLYVGRVDRGWASSEMAPYVHTRRSGAGY